ncbi:MAG TPA: hypothetical protein VM030_08330 [Acidimicrobiales bacterium]|nr:hypothetical protein [Acidimicrobiales bacterium]
MTQLTWGRRYLMCPPVHFSVLYEINSWMHTAVPVDPEAARAQWEGLVATLESAGAVVERLDPVAGLPDLVFTANAGLVDGSRFVASAFRHPQRQGETAIDTAWFAAHGYDIVSLPAGVVHEGAGDALPFAGVLVSGYRTRSDAAAGTALSRLIGAPVRTVELVDPRYYHLDLTFCPLDERRAILNPAGWDRYGCTVMESLVAEPLVLEAEEAELFCANSVVIGTTIVMPACPPRVGRILEGWGFDVIVAAVPEFLKAGGGCRCLTLALDVTLGHAGPSPSSPSAPPGSVAARG